MTDRPPSWREPGLALLAWAVDFTAMYALAAFACDQRVLGWIVTVACATGALAVLLRRRASTTEPDVSNGDADTPALARHVGTLIALLALVAIVWNGFAVLGLPCSR
jgi:hypothetical protein